MRTAMTTAAAAAAAAAPAADGRGERSDGVAPIYLRRDGLPSRRTRRPIHRALESSARRPDLRRARRSSVDSEFAYLTGGTSAWRRLAYRNAVRWACMRVCRSLHTGARFGVDASTLTSSADCGSVGLSLCLAAHSQEDRGKNKL